MQRAKTFDATGVAPNGRLFAGDLNLIQDLAAALSSFSQTVDVGTLRIGDTTLSLSKFGSGELWFQTILRVVGILRGLGGIVSGTFTTTQRDAITAGSRPYGLLILNTTTNRYEFNSGTDAVPVWKGVAQGVVDGDITGPISKAKLGALGIVDADVTGPLSGTKLDLAGTIHASGTIASRPASTAGNQGLLYFATDVAGGTLYRSSTGPAWVQVALGVGGASVPGAHAASHLAGGTDAISWTTVVNAGTLASRPAASASNGGYLYFATDDTGGTLYRSNAAAWVKVAMGLTAPVVPTAHAASHLPGGTDAIDFAGQINRSGTLAARPAAGATNSGALYFATDDNGGVLYRSNGSAWSKWVNVPAVWAYGHFAAQNQNPGGAGGGVIAFATLDLATPSNPTFDGPGAERIHPPIPGYYTFEGAVGFVGASPFQLSVFTPTARIGINSGAYNGYTGVQSRPVFLNGSTDYVWFEWAYNGGQTPIDVANSHWSYTRLPG